MNEMKQCTKCGVSKPLSFFHKRQSRCAECRRIEFQNNAEAKAIYDRQRYSSHTKEHRKGVIGRVSMLVNNARHRAIKNNVLFELTTPIVHVWMIEQDFRCKQTGIRFDFNQNGNQRTLCSPSLDRKDSSIGYTLANSQLVCLFYNLAKNNGTDDQIWSLMRQAVANGDG